MSAEEIVAINLYIVAKKTAEDSGLSIDADTFQEFRVMRGEECIYQSKKIAAIDSFVCGYWNAKQEQK